MDNEDRTSLSDQSMDDCEVYSQDDQGNCRQEVFDPSSKSVKPNKNNGEISAESILGKEFTSTDEAYSFYSSYGGRIGFNVRKQHQRRNIDGIVKRVTYCCSKEGHRKHDKRTEDASYRKPISRSGCKAHITSLLQKNGNYMVVSFDASHNHELIRTPMKHMLKINRALSKAQKAHADDADKSGIPIKSTVELMSREVGGREHLGFLIKDYRNYIHRKRKIAMEKGDAGAILQYFQKMHSENSSFFYSIQLDEDDMITNVFWADSHSVSDYGLFGDVVCFDTTYRTNEYGRPFAPFVGVNHHKQTIVFGAALLYDETTESFKWLFQTFLNAMGGKQPKTILTDQSAAMANAISEVFCDTYHRLCVWHIYQNAAKHLKHVFSGSKEFAHDFGTCVYDYDDEEEWLLAWDNMLKKYNLEENSWLESQFEVRKKWALVYGRHTFTADMKSTQRSESLNSLLKKYLKPGHNFLRFFEHFERVLADRRYEELYADFKMIETTPQVLLNVKMLRHGVEVYTPEVFKLFENECMRILDYSVYKVGKDEMVSTYKLCYLGKTQGHLVTFDATTQAVTCSCMKFTFVGILCAHSLKVLDKKNIKRIPPQYILKRWTKDAKIRSIINYHGAHTNSSAKESMGKRYSHLCRNFREIASCAAEHDSLSAHAHKHSVELLRELEQMKKTLCLSHVSTDHTSQDMTSLSEIKQNEKVVPLDINGATKQPLGVKRKATVGRPRGRFKDPLEHRNPKSKTRKTQISATQPIVIKENHLISCSSQEQQVIGHGLQAYDSSTQDTYNHENYGASGSSQGNLTFTQLLPGSLALCGDLSNINGRE